MRIVLDTNVLVSGLLSPFGPPSRIVGLVLAGVVECVADARILTEYHEVLQRERFDFDPEMLEVVLGELRRRALPVAAPPLPEPLPDPADELFVEVGLAGGAGCLVTGNAAHYPASRCLVLPVLTPAECVEVVRRLSAAGPLGAEPTDPCVPGRMR